MANNIFKRALLLYKRNKTARKFGLVFKRAASWKLPANIQYKDQQFVIYGDDTKDSGTRDAFLDIFIDDAYNIQTIKNKIDLNSIVDVGGHSGLFSLYAKLLNPSSVVHCYEPNPALAIYVQQQAAQTGFTFFPKAVGSENGYVDLAIFDKTILTQTKKTQNGMISLIAIKDVLERIGGSIDLLKLDCEGAEWDIFKDKESFKKIKALTMEFHLTDEIKEGKVKEIINALGFDIQHMQLTGPTWGMLYAYNRQLIAIK